MIVKQTQTKYGNQLFSNRLLPYGANIINSYLKIDEVEVDWKQTPPDGPIIHTDQ